MQKPSYHHIWLDTRHALFEQSKVSISFIFSVYLVVMKYVFCAFPIKFISIFFHLTVWTRYKRRNVLSCYQNINSKTFIAKSFSTPSKSKSLLEWIANTRTIHSKNMQYLVIKFITSYLHIFNQHHFDYLYWCKGYEFVSIGFWLAWVDFLFGQ